MDFIGKDSYINMGRFKKLLRGASAVLLAAGMLAGGVAATTASAVTTARAATLQTTTDATLPDEHVYRMNAFSAETSDLTYDSNWNKSNGNIIMPKQNGATITWRNAGTWLDTDDVEHKIDARITVVNYGGSMAGVNNPSTDDPSRGIKGWYPKLLSQTKKANITLRVDLYYDNNGQLGKAVPSTFKGVTGFTWVPYVRGGNSESVISLDSGFTGIGNDLTSDTHTRLVAKDTQYGNNAFKVTDNPSYQSNSEFIDETYFSVAFSGPSIQFTMINPPVSSATNMSGFLVGYRRAVLFNRFYDVDNGKQVGSGNPSSVSLPVGSVPQDKLVLYEPEYIFKNDPSLASLRADYDFVEKDMTSTFYNMFSATTDGTFITATVPSDTDTSQPIYLRSYLKKKRTVTYNANGGTGSMTDTKMGEPVTASTFTRKGYRFVGWNTRADGTGQSVNAGDVASFTTDTTLYAQWQVASHTVTFDTNGGSAIASQAVGDNAKAKKPADPTRPGWVFDGWYLNDRKYDFNTPVTQGITLKAGWRKDGVTPAKAGMSKTLAPTGKSNRYRLNLSVTGSGSSENGRTPTDYIVFVDESTSMSYTDSTGTKRSTYAKQAIDQLASGVLTAKNSARPAAQRDRISIIRSTQDSSKFVNGVDWHDNADEVKAMSIQDVGGTPWASWLAAMHNQAKTARAGAQKVGLFITDGSPNSTYWDERSWEDPDGEYNADPRLKGGSQANEYSRALVQTKKLASDGWTAFYNVGVDIASQKCDGTISSGNSDNWQMICLTPRGVDIPDSAYDKEGSHSGYYNYAYWPKTGKVASNNSATKLDISQFDRPLEGLTRKMISLGMDAHDSMPTRAGLSDAISKVTEDVNIVHAMRNTTITDPLSKWVDPVGLQDGKGIGITVTKDGKVMTSGYTATYDAKLRAVKVSLPGDLGDGSTYQVAFEVSLSDAARTHYMLNGAYPDTGEADTGQNAGKKGYFTNGDATLKWDDVTTTGGAPLSVSHIAKYAKPVARFGSGDLPPVLTSSLPGTGGKVSLISVISGIGVLTALAATWFIRRRLRQ